MEVQPVSSWERFLTRVGSALSKVPMQVVNEKAEKFILIGEDLQSKAVEFKQLGEDIKIQAGELVVQSGSIESYAEIAVALLGLTVMCGFYLVLEKRKKTKITRVTKSGKGGFGYFTYSYVLEKTNLPSLPEQTELPDSAPSSS